MRSLLGMAATTFFSWSEKESLMPLDESQKLTERDLEMLQFAWRANSVDQLSEKSGMPRAEVEAAIERALVVLPLYRQCLSDSAQKSPTDREAYALAVSSLDQTIAWLMSLQPITALRAA